MKTNIPLKMHFKEEGWSEPRVVHVYDFMHDIMDTMQSFALCWCPWNESWLTVNIAFLTPITVKQLNEG